MSSRLAFQTQLASIMEVLANAAVAEICKLVDDDYAVIHLQMSQCQRENKALKRKLHLLELRMARGCAERRIRENSLNSRLSRVHVNANISFNEKYRGSSTVSEHFVNEDDVYDKRVDAGLWDDGQSSRENPNARTSVATKSKYIDSQSGQETLLVKDEIVENDQDDGSTQDVLKDRAVGTEGKGTLGFEDIQATSSKSLEEHSRIQHHVVEPEDVEDGDPDVLFIKEENLEEEELKKRDMHRGMSVQEEVVESSTNDCMAGITSDQNSPSEPVVACSTREFLDQEHSRADEEDQDEISIISQGGAVIRADDIKDTMCPQEGTPRTCKSSVTQEPVWDLTETDNTPKETQNNESVHRRTKGNHRAALDYSLYERPGKTTCWTTNSPAPPGQPSCTYNSSNIEQDQECLIVHAGTQPRAQLRRVDDVSSSRPLGITRSNVPAARLSGWSRTSFLSGSHTHMQGSDQSEQIQSEGATTTCHPSQNTQRVALNSLPGVGSFAQFNSPSLMTPLLQHTDRVKTKRFVCRFCGKGFAGQSNLESHQRVHTGEKPFRCATCGKPFSEAGNLKKHQRVHTGEKPFTCTRCGKRFAWICNLRTHQQSVACGGL
ncbi:zinc finger E-box-binding homeobox 1 isoform X2 [Denticeps clupeoides]|uniref:C2H2-type domain-containing protein n=1 Tax=Denticeps clupeoides TaxID=299321 RepID=A0AAY4A5I3_9TELE|nr:zinc finger E-box-binding homeobox 1-like isoform X2 [Denticeps clupeoides]